jgi:V-type H+-transporting ATPase subunit H
LTNISKSAVKEKVTRVIISTFRNLLFLAPTQNIPSMFTSKLLPFVTSLQSRKFADEDLAEDLVYLSDELKKRLEGMGSWEEYVNELESGHLVWSPAHESEDFWKENGRKVGSDEGGKGVKRLVELLKANRDGVVLAVAAHDLGQFVKYGGDKAKQ